MTETVGFTGSRHLTGEMQEAIKRALIETQVDATIVTGACLGVDAYVALIAWRTPYLKVHTIVPADRSRVDPYWRDHCDTFEEMPPGTTYRDRNERIVALSDRLIAVPDYPEDAPESRRSGTWMTIRIARRTGRPVQVVTLERRRSAAPAPPEES
jgi:predicted Rossmann fold nucleotide-binding protein DprA/Smf involved in DNA uptake